MIAQAFLEVPPGLLNYGDHLMSFAAPLTPHQKYLDHLFSPSIQTWKSYSMSVER